MSPTWRADPRHSGCNTRRWSKVISIRTSMKTYLPKFSSNKAVYFILTFCVITVGIPVGYAAHQRKLKNKYERGLNMIEIGDSKQRVITLMGEPDAWERCYPLPASNESPEQKKLHEECVDQCRYVTFMEWYMVAFDKNGHVSWKGRSVSP